MIARWAALLLVLGVPARAADEDPTPQQIQDALKAPDGHKVECWMLPCGDKADAIYDEITKPGAYNSAHKAMHATIKENLTDVKDSSVLAWIARAATGLRETVTGKVHYEQARRVGDDKAMAQARQQIDKGYSDLHARSPKGEMALKSLMHNDPSRSLASGLPRGPAGDRTLGRIRDAVRDSPRALSQVGNEQLARAQPKAALESFNKALSLEPGNSDALTGRAAANMDLKNYRDASADAKEALRYNPKDPAAQAIVMLAHDTAAGGFKPSAGLSSGSSGDAAQTGVSAGNGAAPGASRSKGLVASDGSALQSSAYARQAMRDMSLGDVHAAILAADRAVELDPRSADALSLRAFAEARAGRYEDALRDAAAALALDPKNALAHNARAKAYNSMGMYHEGLAAASDALRAERGNAYAEYMRAMSYNGMGDRPNAVTALEHAARLDPRFRDAADLARSSPEEKDLAFLFPEENLANVKAMLAARSAAPGRKGLPLTVTMLLGLALVMGGLLHWLLWPAVRGALGRLGRNGPAVGTNATIGGLAFPGPASTAAGTLLRGQYRRLGQIGQSVHGAVYEGVDLSLERAVAIRKLRAEMRAADRERLLLPARLAAPLNHPGVASLYAVVDEAEALYLISEFATGRTLRDVLAAKGPLPAEEAVPLFKRVAAAVDYAHGRGVVHGAIRASNIFVMADGSAKLVDFGLARGPADRVGDLQAFAACLREAIAGLAPSTLDAVDAALARERAMFGNTTRIIQIVEAVLEASRH
jgi:tetratricopeptide (TPR) repeat protein/tRNA A-37 threonylcarbamoyl transferase component Bud32